MIAKPSRSKKTSIKSYFKDFSFVLGFYLFVLISFVIGWFIFNFPNNGVTGPGNEFYPFMRLSFLIFIIIYPFTGFFTFLGYLPEEFSIDQNYLISSNIKLIIKSARTHLGNLTSFLTFFLLWPGIYLLFGYFIGIMNPIFDASIPVPSYWDYYWLVYFILGRIIDYGQLHQFEEKFHLQVSHWNFVFQILLLILIDSFIFIIAITLQIFAFLASITLLVPFLFAFQDPYLSSFSFLGIIAGINFVVALSVLSTSFYIATMYLRGKMRRIILKKDQVLYHRK